MKKDFKYWLRWIFILPLCVLTVFLIDFPVHWALYSFIEGLIHIEPYPRAPEEIIGPFFRGLVFVCASYYIAPSSKLIVSAIFTALWTIAFVILNFIVTSRLNLSLDFKYYGIPIVLGFIGAFVGLYLSYNDSKRESYE